jgi:FixJ family two-component response regulator
MEALRMTTSANALVIYIIDDDASVRKGLLRLMRAAGFEPKVFETADAFMRNVHEGSRGCVVLDMTMPWITGLQVQACMKQKGIVLPVIAISTRDDEETRHIARAQGAQFFLRKPVDDQALLDAIAWVSGSSRNPPPR